MRWALGDVVPLVQVETALACPGPETFLSSLGLLLVHVTLIPIKNGSVPRDTLLLAGDFLKKINNDYNKWHS